MWRGLLVCLCAVLLLAVVPGTARPREQRSLPAVRLWKFEYLAHDGRDRAAYVLLPAWYGPNHNPPLPLIISPHGRGVDGQANARLWGRIPATHRLAVVNPDGEGRRLPLFSWGYSGQISDLARMPKLLHHALPWIRLAPDRVYAVAASMGGQEALLLTARDPGMLKGTAVFDAPTDFALQYRLFPKLPCDASCRQRWRGPIGLGLQRLARTEVGGSPSQVPSAYAARSPLQVAQRIARSGVPLGFWWSPRDRVISDPARQELRFLDVLADSHPRAEVHDVAGSWRHERAMRLNLRAALKWLHLEPSVSGTT